jgi:hypothetical protein
MVIERAGFATVIGVKNEIVDAAALVRRLYMVGKIETDDKELNIPVYLPKFAGLGCLTGDEVVFRNTPVVVLGLADGYLWMVGPNGRHYCATTSDTLGQFVTIVARPASRPRPVFVPSTQFNCSISDSNSDGAQSV